MTSDGELLQQYRAGSQAAYEELVTRHVHWVYAASLRQTGDPHLAEDITQAVFIALVKARPRRGHSSISAWLFKVMRYATANELRAARRRKHHEAQAARMHPTTIEADTQSELSPLLEDAVERLPGRYRQAILLRFYEQRSVPDVAISMGISEQAARKRIHRGVEKLKRHFSAIGIAPADEPLTTALDATAGHVAPAALIASITTHTAASSAATHLALGALHMIHRAFLIRVGSIVAAGIAAVAPCVWLVIASCTSTTKPVQRENEFGLSNLAAHVASAESSIQTLYIKDFKTTIDVKNPRDADWKTTPMEYTGSAWFDDKVGGKARIYFAKHVMKWEQGTAPWAESVKDESWDGTRGFELYIAGGPLGQVQSDRQAILTADAPRLLSERFARLESGPAYALQYKVNETDDATPPQPRRSLSWEISQSIKAGLPPQVERETVNGASCVRIRFFNMPASTGSETYWLDPDRGWAMIRHEKSLHLGKTNRDETLNVMQLKSIAPGVWFPLSATAVVADNASPGTYMRYTYTAADAVANDPKWDPSIFSAPIPNGYFVSDRRGEPKGYVAQRGNDIPIHTGDVVPYVRPGEAQRPDAR
jgi:RNA polymerase sigma factor (sigma-70 family)